jgi:hypothetical protein
MDMRKLLISSALAVLFAMGGASARADVVYSYTGLVYTNVTGSYTTSMKVTGSIDLTSALGANFGPASLTPNFFSFSDGLQTFTNTTPGLTSNFDVFQTNSLGQIITWDVAFSIPAGLGFDEITVTVGGDNPQVFWSCSTSSACESTAFVNTAGSWSAPVSTVPLPAALPLFATGLAGLGLLGWRRKKALSA